MHSICKIENKSHFIRNKFLFLDLVFEKITIFLFFEGYFLGNFQKNRSQKPSMLEENKDSFGICIEFLTKLRIPIFDFCFVFILVFFSGLIKSNCNFYSKIFPHQKNKTKIENRDSKFCAEFDADSKTVLVFFLALIVFDFYSFEGSKTHFTGRQMYIIYTHILSIIRGFWHYKCI